MSGPQPSGIPPAAELDPEAGGHICPACGVLCTGQRDAGGAWLSDAYAAHCTASHEAPG